MNLQTLKRELNRLHRLVEEWQSVDEIAPIERDLVLERLRELYAALNWGLEEEITPEVSAAKSETPAEEAAEEPVEEPIEEEEVHQAAPVEEEEEPFAPLDAAAFISLDVLLEREEEAPAEPAIEEEPALEELPVAEEPAVTEVEEPMAEEQEPEPEPIAVAEPEPEPEPEPIAEEPEPIVVVEEPEPDPIAVAEPEPIVEEQPEPVVGEQPIVEPEPAPAPEVRPAVQNLFGETEAEEAHTRHRHKQRVIMSLYDTVPEPQPRRRETKLRIENLIPPESKVRVVQQEPEVIEMSEEELVAPKRKTAPVHSEEPAQSTPMAEVKEIEVVGEVKAAEPIEPMPTATTPEVATLAEEAAPAPTLGETLPHVQTLGEKLAAERETAVAEVRREPITDLRRAVGINDKFLLIRDLFGGNGSLYEITIRRLNEFDNLDDCLIYITEHFNWNPNSDGAQLMMELLERKFVG